MVDYFISEGNSGRTFAVSRDGETDVQIEFPNGKYGDVYTLEEFNGWNIQRFEGQLDTQEVSEETFTEEYEGGELI